MSVVTNMTEHCLEAFLKRHRSWYGRSVSSEEAVRAAETPTLNQRMGIPVYSSKDAQQRVEEPGVIDLLYRILSQNASAFLLLDVPELNLPLLDMGEQSKRDHT